MLDPGLPRISLVAEAVIPQVRLVDYPSLIADPHLAVWVSQSETKTNAKRKIINNWLFN
jgi:hypothetical protein